MEMNHLKELINSGAQNKILNLPNGTTCLAGRFAVAINLLLSLEPACRPPISRSPLTHGSRVNYLEEVQPFCAQVVEKGTENDLITCSAKENGQPVDSQFSCYDQNLASGLGIFLDQNNGQYSEVRCVIGGEKQ